MILVLCGMTKLPAQKTVRVFLYFFVLGVLSYLTPLLPPLTLMLTLVRVVETVFVLLQSK